MAVANSLQMLKTVIMDFSVIKPHFSWWLSRLLFSAGSWLSRIFRGRLASLAQIAAGSRLSRRFGGLYLGNKAENLPLALRSLPRVFSQKFLQQLKTTLFDRPGVGSASELSHLKRHYINVCNECINE